MKLAILCKFSLVVVAASSMLFMACNTPTETDNSGTENVTTVTTSESTTTSENAPKVVAVVEPQDKGWGDLKGQIIIKGEAPKNKQEEVGDHPDKPACLVDGKVPDDDAFVVGKNNELANVFVIMYTGRGAEVPKKFHPDYDKQKVQTLTLDNQKCRFVPKAIFVRSGQKVLLKNSDNVGHNCRIATMAHEKNVNIPKNDGVEVTMDMADDRVPGDVFCDIHKWMDSLIFVRDNPYVAITDADGKFTIKNIPPGKWKFQFWHKKGGYLDELEVNGYELDRRGSTEVEIKADEVVDLGAMNLPVESLDK